MDFNAAAREYGTGIVSGLKKNWRMLVLLVLFTIGMIFGTILVKNGNNSVVEVFTDIFNTYIKAKKSQSLGMNFLNSFAVNMTFLLCTFIFGLCAVGLPLLSFLPVVKGIGIGMLSGYLYSTFALKGLGYCVLILYPGLIPAVMSLFMACSIGFGTSYEVLQFLSSVKTVKGERGIKLYCMQFLVIIVLATIASIIDAVAIRIFSGLFNF